MAQAKRKVAQTPPHRRRLPGVAINSGSVQKAREAAGLSLSQLAGDDLTRAAVHLIETGQAKPSLPVLEMISRRTGRPMSAFASDGEILRARGLTLADMEQKLAGIERLYEADQYQQALGAAEDALTRLGSLSLEFEARYWIARAALMLGNTGRALEEVDACLAHYEESGDRLRLAECLDCKGSALYVAQDERAETYFVLALRQLDAINPDPFTFRSRVLSHLGALYIETHDYDKAVATLENAVAVAQGVLDLGRVGLLYDSLGLAYSELGQPRKALEYAHKAVALHRARQDHLALANAENNLGFVLVRRGDFRSARSHLDASLKLYEELGVEHRKAHVLLSLAELHLEARELQLAKELVEQAIQLATNLDERMNIAVGWQLLGRIAEFTSDPKQAERHFATAISMLESLQASDRLVDAYTEYGRLLEGRGDDKAAVRYFKLALDTSRGTKQAEQKSEDESAASA